MPTQSDSCKRKVRYPDRATAMRRARYLARYAGRGFRRMEAYPCMACGRWHVGHPIGMHAHSTY